LAFFSLLPQEWPPSDRGYRIAAIWVAALGQTAEFNDCVAPLLSSGNA